VRTFESHTAGQRSWRSLGRLASLVLFAWALAPGANLSRGCDRRRIFDPCRYGPKYL